MDAPEGIAAGPTDLGAPGRYRAPMPTFEGTVEAARGGGAYVEIPARALAALGGGSRFRVTGTVGDVGFESSTMPLGAGRICVGLHKATRQAAGIGIGDRVRLALERDERPRTVDVPPALRDALAGDPAARAAFDALSLSHRREYAEWVAEAKRDETRERRVAQTLERLRGGGAGRR
jgi:Bacteriocin-protection, YdeI or OmpD-Associated/Domain of unknown function (DUF1905)